jgi:hypothetical protein
LAAKDANNASSSALLTDAQNDVESISNEQRGEQMNRLLYKILNEIEQRIGVLPGASGKLLWVLFGFCWDFT